MIRKKVILIATLLFMASTISAKVYQVKSPNGKICAELSTEKAFSIQFGFKNKVLFPYIRMMARQTN